VGPADDAATTMGPVVSDVQFERVQRLIAVGIGEGARVVAGGLGRPQGLERGYYVRPTVFADVKPSMTIARDEIFGPVLAIMPYRDEDEAVAIANDSPFGLAAYVQSGDSERARRVGFRLRAGSVYLNYPSWDAGAPFGGYKQSGNGREYGEWGLEAFLEVKALVGFGR
jgi:aldehyde dehydrogenase (NAD+)